MQNILGVVLCGGQSKRMGSDKGLLKIDDNIWALYMAGKILALQIPVVYSINETQMAAYSQHILPGQLIIDTINIEGPLKGLLSVHKKFPQQDLLLMACDMLQMDSVTIHTILQTYNQEPEYDFYVYEDAAYAQPFCGIYTAAALAKAYSIAASNQLKNYSMQHLLHSANTKKIPTVNSTAFCNYNEPYTK